MNNRIFNFIKKYKKLLILILIIILLLTIIFLIIGNLISSNNRENPEISTSFFIKNEDNKYALFNNKGKRISDYIYSLANDFYNGVSKVSLKDKFGVINESGKYIIKLGKYEEIYQYGSLFKVSEEDSKYSLLNSKGKRLIKKKKFNVISLKGTDTFMVVDVDNKYIIYNYNGEKIYDFKKNKNVISQVNEISNYASIYYDNLTLVFNTRTGKIVSKIKDKEAYSIKDVSEDNSTIVLTNDKLDSTKYKVIIDNKLKDIKESCQDIYLDDNLLVCLKNDKKYLLDNKLKISNVEVNSSIYIDSKNYATLNDTTVEIYRNNKKIKTLKNANLADRTVTKQGIYLIYIDGRYQYYDNKGKKIFKNTYRQASVFDSNDLARVSEDGEKYYLINTKGKKVSNDYTFLRLEKDYYLYSNKDNMGVLSKTGKVLLKDIYRTLEIRKINNNYYAYGIDEDNKHYLIDLNTKKEILKSNELIITHDNYLVTNNKYYTYTGENFKV